MGLAKTDDGWRLLDDICSHLEHLLSIRKPHRFNGHNHRVSNYDAMNYIILVIRTDMQWNALNTTDICCYSYDYRSYCKWLAAGVFTRFWKECLLLYDRDIGIDWSFISVDGAMTKAPLGGKRWNRI